MRSFNITEPNALEKLVKRTSTKIAQKPLIMPIQKDINLKDPILKNKGIRKKNNINNKYILLYQIILIKFKNDKK